MFTAGTSGRSCGNWQASMTHSIDSVEIHAIRIKCFRDALFIRKRRSTNSSKPQRRGMQASDTGRLSMFISVVEALQVRGEVGGRLSDLSAKNFFSWISQVIIIARGGGKKLEPGTSTRIARYARPLTSFTLRLLGNQRRKKRDRERGVAPTLLSPSGFTALFAGAHRRRRGRRRRSTAPSRLTPFHPENDPANDGFQLLRYNSKTN